MGLFPKASTPCLIAAYFLALFFAVFAYAAHAKTLYKWVDEDGRVVVTDNRSKLPIDAKGVEEVEARGANAKGANDRDGLPAWNGPALRDDSDAARTNEELAVREETRRRFRERALKLYDREQGVLEDISATEDELYYKKREVDYLLIYGYSADYSIYDLRYLESRLESLRSELPLIAKEREKLQREARKAGVPPGYLRP